MAEPVTGSGAAAAPTGLKILIVDDSAIMRAFIRRAIGVCGVPVAEIYESANGADALALLEAHDIDAVFTDINMPVMTGTELLREIARRGSWDHLVRVIISTDGSESRRRETAELGVHHYVEKPFRPEVMQDVLSAVAARTDLR